MEFTKKISYSMSNGKRITTIKTFRNLHHFDNYFNKLIKANCNIIELIDFYNPVKSSDNIGIQDEQFYKILRDN